MNTQKLLLSSAIATSLLVMSGASFAASSGSMGSSSSGNVNISASVQQKVKVSGLSDIALGTYSGTGALSGGTNACVYSNSPGQAYKVTASVSNAASFQMSGSTDPSNAINFGATWGGQALTFNQAATGFTGSSSPNCGGSTNAAFNVSVDEPTMLAAAPDTYAATVDLLIEPA